MPVNQCSNMVLEQEIERLKANRDYWHESCLQAQDHRDGANAKLEVLEREIEHLKAIRAAERERICAEIKAADDKASELKEELAFCIASVTDYQNAIRAMGE